MARDVGVPMEAPWGCAVWVFPGKHCRDRTCGIGASVKSWCGHKAGVPHTPDPVSTCLVSHGSPLLATAGQAGRSCCCCGEKTPPQPHIPIPWHRASTCPPPALLWSFQRLRHLSRQVWRRAVGLWIVRGREGTERSRRGWGLSV